MPNSKITRDNDIFVGSIAPLFKMELVNRKTILYIRVEPKRWTSAKPMRDGPGQARWRKWAIERCSRFRDHHSYSASGTLGWSKIVEKDGRVRWQGSLELLIVLDEVGFVRWDALCRRIFRDGLKKFSASPVKHLEQITTIERLDQAVSEIALSLRDHGGPRFTLTEDGVVRRRLKRADRKRLYRSKGFKKGQTLIYAGLKRSGGEFVRNIQMTRGRPLGHLQERGMLPTRNPSIGLGNP